MNLLITKSLRSLTSKACMVPPTHTLKENLLRTTNADASLTHSLARGSIDALLFSSLYGEKEERLILLILEESEAEGRKEEKGLPTN